MVDGLKSKVIHTKEMLVQYIDITDGCYEVQPILQVLTRRLVSSKYVCFSVSLPFPRRTRSSQQ